MILTVRTYLLPGIELHPVFGNMACANEWEAMILAANVPITQDTIGQLRGYHKNGLKA